MLALTAVHNHLIREGTRTQVALIIESGEPREVMHYALLIGYGASAINPYLAVETLEDLSIRGYLPEGVPLLKHVAAKAGQRVCRIGAVVSVDARPVATARARDGKGRPLPIWRGCRTLKPGEIFLLNPSVPDSLDGRYFGPLPTSAVIGRATPLHLRAPSQTPSTLEAKEIGHADEYL